MRVRPAKPYTQGPEPQTAPNMQPVALAAAQGFFPMNCHEWRKTQAPLGYLERRHRRARSRGLLREHSGFLRRLPGATRSIPPARGVYVARRASAGAADLPLQIRMEVSRAVSPWGRLAQSLSAHEDRVPQYTFRARWRCRYGRRPDGFGRLRPGRAECSGRRCPSAACPQRGPLQCAFVEPRAALYHM